MSIARRDFIGSVMATALAGATPSAIEDYADGPVPAHEVLILATNGAVLFHKRFLRPVVMMPGDSFQITYTFAGWACKDEGG